MPAQGAQIPTLLRAEIGVLLSIVGQLGKRTGERAERVSREWRGSVEMAKELGMYDVKLLPVAAGGAMTVVCTAKGELFTFGKGLNGQLGHGVKGMSLWRGLSRHWRRRR